MKNEPVFPCKVPTGGIHANGDPAPTKQHYGMTLRDYFAAKAMQSLIEVHNDTMRISDDDGWVSLHLRAYEHADGMLKARQE